MVMPYFGIRSVAEYNIRFSIAKFYIFVQIVIFHIRIQMSGFLANRSRIFYSISLTHLSRMNIPTSIDRRSLFQNLGVLGGIFIFIQKFIL